jgi:hypothetical protein
LQDRSFLPPERDTAEPGDQRLPAVAIDGGFEARVGPVRCGDDGLELAGHFVTVEPCFAANVLSMEVSMTHRSRSNLQTSPASR